MSQNERPSGQDILNQLKTDCGKWKPTNEWAGDSNALNLVAVPIWDKENPEYQKRSAEALEIWRCITLRGQSPSEPPPHKELLEAIWPYAARWINFLLKPSTETHYFQEFRSLDETFYEGPQNSRPKPRQEGVAFDPLPWLKHPDRLTIAELELALAIFQWNTGNDPKLAWWVKRRPYLLHKIHGFLLQRYCFPLLSALRQARKKATPTLDLPPYRAVEHEWINPRLTGFVAVGTLAIIGLDFLPAFYFADFCYNLPVLLLAILLLGILRELVYVDIFKQNKPLLADRRQARYRAHRLIWATLWRSGVFGLIMGGFWALAEQALGLPNSLTKVFNTVADTKNPSWNLSNLVWPHMLGLESTWYLECWRYLTGFSAFVLSAAVLGFLLQGFWEDASALEPI